MDALTEIESRLAEIPQLKYVRTATNLEVPAGNPYGFHVSIVSVSHSYVVYYDGWHEHFENAEDAISCFRFGLSEACRVRVWQHGAFRHKWQLEYRDSGEWRVDSIVGILWYPFWRPRSTFVLQNQWITNIVPLHH
jgi:hypothetical protein